MFSRHGPARQKNTLTDEHSNDGASLVTGHVSFENEDPRCSLMRKMQVALCRVWQGL